MGLCFSAQRHPSYSWLCDHSGQTEHFLSILVFEPKNWRKSIKNIKIYNHNNTTTEEWGIIKPKCWLLFLCTLFYWWTSQNRCRYASVYALTKTDSRPSPMIFITFQLQVLRRRLFFTILITTEEYSGSCKINVKDLWPELIHLF